MRTTQQFGQRVAPAAGRHVGRCLKHEVAQHIGDRLEARAIVIQALRIAGGKLRDFPRGVAGADLQIGGLIQGKKIRQLALDDAQAVARQFELADDFGVEQRHRVRGHGIAESRVKFFGHRGSPDDGAPFEHGDFEAGRRQIRGADQPIVASADNHHVAQRISHRAFQARCRCATRGAARVRAGFPE
jgi:hypothetical protein